jgi:hypothetical protein
VSNQECIDKKANDGTGVYDSFQGIVVESNGYQFQPELFVDDIDALETNNTYRGQLDAWRESSIVFGMSNGAVVHPVLSFTPGTMLQRQAFTIPAQAMAELGFGAFGEVNVNGAQFNDRLPPHNCPFAAEDVASECRMQVKFEEPIDKLLILYAATHKADQDPNAVMFASMLKLPCSCLCSEGVSRGVKYFPVAGVPGQCTRRDESERKARFKCDMLATENVCAYGYVNYLERVGDEISSGRYACRDASAVTITEHRPYDPNAAFSP